MSYNPTNLIEKQWQGIKNIVEPQGRSRKTLAITHRQVETAVHGIQPEVVGIFFSCCQIKERRLCAFFKIFHFI